MTKTIWKYTLEHRIQLQMPKGAEVLTVREQGEEICLWALVDPSAEKETRQFHSFGTGHDVDDLPMKYVGTSHLEGGALVFHTFEVVG
jgi:hypothetical protein